MLEQIFTNNWIINQHRTGPLGDYSDRLARNLVEAGFCQAVLRHRFGVISDLNRWLKKRNLKLSDLCPTRVNAFSNYRKRKVRAYYRSGDHAMLERLLTMLRNDGVVPAEVVLPRWGVKIHQAISPFERIWSMRRASRLVRSQDMRLVSPGFFKTVLATALFLCRSFQQQIYLII